MERARVGEQLSGIGGGGVEVREESGAVGGAEG